MSSGDYGDRGNRDLSIANPKGMGEARPVREGGHEHAAPGGPFLIGEAMTGGYGRGADILHGCTIAVDRGEIAVIVGPNGAGKSTAMKAVFGMLSLREGMVRLDGEDITALTPQARVRKGMGDGQPGVPRPPASLARRRPSPAGARSPSPTGVPRPLEPPPGRSPCGWPSPIGT